MLHGGMKGSIFKKKQKKNEFFIRSSSQLPPLVTDNLISSFFFFFLKVRSAVSAKTLATGTVELPLPPSSLAY